MKYASRFVNKEIGEPMTNVMRNAVSMLHFRLFPKLAVLPLILTATVYGEDKPIKAFILAGQSNMRGWGDSAKLPKDLRQGSDRVLMFEDGEWQPLKPHSPAFDLQRSHGLREFHFGPEISFAHELAKAFPDERIGIIKYAAGGSSILAWKPDWSREYADRIGQGGRGSLYKNLIDKVKQAQDAGDIEIVGFLWQQGARDMTREDTAKEYLDNLKSLVAAIRKDSGFGDLRFLYGSYRTAGIPDDLSDLTPKKMKGARAWAQWVIKAQVDAEKAIPNAKMVIVRDLESHPKNPHFNTAGQLALGKLFAEAYLESEQDVTGLTKTLAELNSRSQNVDVELIEWPDELHRRLGKFKKIAFLASPKKRPVGKLPLLVSLHGGGGRTMSVEKQLTRSAEVKGLALAEFAVRDLVLLEPNTTDIWDAKSLNLMLDHFLENHPKIDKTRVYVMGHSMGGWGTWVWINESPERFAAAAPCGFPAGETGDAKLLVNLPIWGMAGGEDGARTTGIRRMVERLKAASNTNVKHSEFPGANHSEGNAAVFRSVELVDWMLGFSRRDQ